MSAADAGRRRIEEWPADLVPVGAEILDQHGNRATVTAILDGPMWASPGLNLTLALRRRHGGSEVRLPIAKNALVRVDWRASR